MPDLAQTFVVSPEEAGTRLDLFLARKLKLGRAQVTRMLGRGVVKLNARITTAKDKGLLLYAASKVDVVETDRPESASVTPQSEIPLVVLAEGAGWVAVDKPAGMPVHPLEPGEQGTLLNAVLARYPEMQGVGEGGLRSGVVHRLDVDTSGVVLFAKMQAEWTKLRSTFEEHRTKKNYRAIVAGNLTGNAREEMPLVVAQHRPARVKVVEHDHPKGRMCNLSWRAVEQLPGATLLEIELGTGFLHQIRVMMAHLGHPIIGDTLYGPPEQHIAAPRQMLHASFIRAADAQATSREPGDFVQVLKNLRA